MTTSDKWHLSSPLTYQYERCYKTYLQRKILHISNDNNISSDPIIKGKDAKN